MISLFKPKTNPAGAVETNKTKKQPGKPLYLFWLETFTAIAILIVIVITALLVFNRQQASTTANHNLELRTEALAQRFSQYLNLYHSMLQGLAADPALPALVSRGDSKAIADREQLLEKIIPGALRVRLLNPGHDTPNLDSEPPLGYASIKLLRTAEESTYPPPIEIHQVKGNKLYVVGAASLKGNDGQVQGLLHLTLSATMFRDEIIAFGTDQGRVAMQQQVNNDLATILGDTSATTSPDGLRPIASSELRLAYWYSGSSDIPLFYAAVITTAIFLLGVALLLWLQHSRLYTAIVDDQNTLIDAFRDLISGRKAKRYVITLREFNQIMDFLTQQIRGGLTQAKIAQTGPVVSEVRLQDTEQATQASEQPAAAEPQIKTNDKQPQVVNKDVKIERTVVQQVIAPVGTSTRPVTSASPADIALPEPLFRACDIRGIIGKNGITNEIATELGRAIGSLLHDRGKQTVSVARDVRPSSDNISSALITGLVASGRDVMDLGMVPTPLLYFATRSLDSDSGIMISAGRFPVDYNGFKIIIDGEQIIGQEILDLRTRSLQGPIYEGVGSTRNQDIISDYIQRVVDDVQIASPLKIVLDCGSGCSSLVAPKLFAALGCEVVELFCEPNSKFPGHAPDPGRPENLKILQAKVMSERADIGFAFDLDGDRLGVIDSRGRIIWPDRLLMVLAADVSGRNPGADIIFDVNCSRALASQILENGGRPVMWKAGHPALKIKLRDIQALLAGEWGGHIIFQERWYGFDDACYAAARLLEILAVDARTSAELFDSFPESISTPEFSLKVQEGEQYAIIEKIQKRGDLLSEARLVTIDGLRAEYEDGWGLVRASNTMAALRFRFEANNEAALNRIQEIYRKLLAAVEPSLKAPF